jgi:hypothetical protein
METHGVVVREAEMTGEPVAPRPAVGAPTHSPDGVDLGLVRWFLGLTPEQRLETLPSFIDFVVEARNARESGTIR